MNDDKETLKNVDGLSSRERQLRGLTQTGRPKGTPNKTTALLKDAILLAAQNAGGGGPDGIANYLCKQAKETPTAFMALLGKILPMQVTGENGGAVKIEAVILAPLKRHED